MQFLVKKGGANYLDWRYRANKIQSWSIFPDAAAKDINFMSKFLKETYGAKPELVFSDDAGNQTTFVEVTKGTDRVNVRINAGQRRHTLLDRDLWPLPDQLAFLQAHADQETNEKINTSEVWGAVRQHKEMATPEAKAAFTAELAAKLTDENITKILREREGENANIYFI